MPIEVLVAARNTRLHTVGSYLLFALPFTLALTGVVLVGGLFGVRWSFRRAQREAQLMTHSSAFWARWPPDRLARAPYAELAAEATRCGQLVGCAEASLRSARKRPGFVHTGDHFDRRLAEYQGMFATVAQAMARYPRQGRPTA